MKRDPFKLPAMSRRLDSLYTAVEHSMMRPYIGVTQGGSSRKDRGAKVAATAKKQGVKWNAGRDRDEA